MPSIDVKLKCCLWHSGCHKTPSEGALQAVEVAVSCRELYDCRVRACRIPAILSDAGIPRRPVRDVPCVTRSAVYTFSHFFIFVIRIITALGVN